MYTAHTASDVFVTLLPIHYMQILFWQIKELTEKYAQLEQNVVEMRSEAIAEVTSFFDEIDAKLDKLSRQVARVQSRLHTYHEVYITIKLRAVTQVKVHTVLRTSMNRQWISKTFH